MRCFEITLQGYNPKTSNTDHLIKWVLAPSIQFVELWLASTGLNTQGTPREMGDYADSYDWEDGVDAKLDTEGKVKWNPMYPAKGTTLERTGIVQGRHIMPGTQLWIWNWIGGGYNSCRAETRTEAIAQSKTIAGQTVLVIDENTLHVGTPEELQQLDAAYNMD